MVATHSAAALLGWLEPGKIERHWHGATDPAEIGSKSVADDEPMVEAGDFDFCPADDIARDMLTPSSPSPACPC